MGKSVTGVEWPTRGYAIARPCDIKFYHNTHLVVMIPPGSVTVACYSLTASASLLLRLVPATTATVTVSPDLLIEMSPLGIPAACGVWLRVAAASTRPYAVQPHTGRLTIPVAWEDTFRPAPVVLRKRREVDSLARYRLTPLSCREAEDLPLSLSAQKALTSVSLLLPLFLLLPLLFMPLLLRLTFPHVKTQRRGGRACFFQGSFTGTCLSLPDPLCFLHKHTRASAGNNTRRPRGQRSDDSSPATRERPELSEKMIKLWGRTLVHHTACDATVGEDHLLRGCRDLLCGVEACFYEERFLVSPFSSSHEHQKLSTAINLQDRNQHLISSSCSSCRSIASSTRANSLKGLDVGTRL
ncbi:hypothetical protein O3P69_006848 [Scylla paramamosain]|uniref:Uncharacterized protein n=1 Tax=Scylla paramamosain TaxID=85552 RepID=A0AAW0U246_SCYPA